MRTWATVLVAMGVLIGFVVFAARAAETAAPPKDAAEKPAVEAPPAPDVVAVLDKMDAVGKDLKTLRAKFDYELNQTLFEDIQKRKGELTYEAPNHLRFEFTTKPQEVFIFDGRTLFNRKDATRQLFIWELRAPDEKPVESLELGKTPFPLPFGQKKEDVLKHFSVTRDAKEEEADKDKRPVLALVPKKDTPLAKDYTKILLWVDPKTALPTRARLYDTSENITTVDFHDIETNKAVDPKLFTRPTVPQDWETIFNAREK